MKKSILLLLILTFILNACRKPSYKKSDFPTAFEVSGGIETATYKESIKFYELLDEAFDEMSLMTFGNTDAGKPLHLAVLSDDACNLYQLKERGEKRLLLINNAIHPGEPDGVDATMMLYRDLLLDSALNREEYFKDLIIVAIPFYNIGGALNRNSHSRTNQNGPLEYGFRGNAQNLDLNRDFIKCDSRNALSFAKLIQHLDPDLYIETHVSNGADYQYTMTYLPSQIDKLGKHLGAAMQQFLTHANQKMKTKGHEMSPYVNTHKNVPDSGITAFYDSPRYSTGYLATLGIPGIITETHMLKPYKNRVLSTYAFLQVCSDYMSKDRTGYALTGAKNEERKAIASSKNSILDWELNTDTFQWLSFRGYEYSLKPSGVSGQDRLFYDREKPFTKKIRYYHHLTPTKTVDKPEAYLLKRGYVDVEQLLKANKVKMETLKSDSILNVVRTKIENFDTRHQPYEKHYNHFDVQISRDTMTIKFLEGDWLISMGTAKDRFVTEVLEPEGPDSYFAWNFFDAVLQQKEWYSAYVFEDEAAKMLKNDAELRQRFEAKKSTEPAFANNAQYQLYWLFQNSAHYEKEHMVLPVFRIEGKN